jgi:hypothetical protein
MNVDSTGRRRTVQPPPSAGARPILLFGGSAMWGLTARDSMTIGSRIAATLARRGVTGLYVVNDAQPAFVSTQEAATFQGDLANGVQPAAVIFLDGYNDVQSAIQNGTVGRTYTEGEAQRLIDLGRRQFWADVGGLWRHSALVARLLEMRHAPAQPAVKADALCPPVAQYYAQLMRAQIAVARERGFPILIFLQPHNASTHKRLTAWEAALPRDPRLDVCDDSIASAMAAFAGREFFDLRRLFDLDTQTVFVDFRSHVTEEGNERIAEVMADRLLPLIGPHVRNNQRAPTTGPDRGR